MESKDKNKWQVRAAALTIFVLGFAAGALSLNLYNSRRPAGPQDNRQRRIEQMLDRLDLNEDQRSRMEEIMKDTRARMDAIRKESSPQIQEARQESRRRMQEVLTPAQWEELQDLMKRNRGGRRDRNRDNREAR